MDGHVPGLEISSIVMSVDPLHQRKHKCREHTSAALVVGGLCRCNNEEGVYVYNFSCFTQHHLSLSSPKSKKRIQKQNLVGGIGQIREGV